MRVAVIGAGAMGSIAALLLSDAGARVVVYDRREERIAALRERGVSVAGALRGEAFPEVGMIGEPAPPFDAIVLAVGAGEGAGALRPLSPFVHRDTIYISLQDGGAVTLLAGMVGEEKAFAATAWVSACEVPAGEVMVEDFRCMTIGGMFPGREKAVEALAMAVGSVHPGRITLTPEVEAEIWKRLEAAAAVSGICAIAGSPPREARAIEGLEALCEEAAEECRRVSAAAGCHQGDGTSPWDGAVWRDIKPPMLADIEAGRKTEVAYMSGHVVERARTAGVPVPVHNALLTLVREMESERHHPGKAAVKELKRRVAEEKGMSLL